MVGTLDRLASDLADESVAAMKETGEDRLYMEAASVLGASPQSLEEAFLTEIGVRLSLQTAREFLHKRLDQLRKAKPDT